MSRRITSSTKKGLPSVLSRIAALVSGGPLVYQQLQMKQPQQNPQPASSTAATTGSTGTYSPAMDGVSPISPAGLIGVGHERAVVALIRNTVSVVVQVTGVPFAVSVRVQLIGVQDLLTIVEGVQNPVSICVRWAGFALGRSFGLGGTSGCQEHGNEE